MGGLALLCLLPIGINFQQHVILEFGFFGFGFLHAIPYSFLQPLIVVFHVVMPVLALFYLVLSFWPALSTVQQSARGMARSLAVLFLFMLGLNFALMQKNRVLHALNYFLPQELSVGVIEENFLNQNLRVATNNFMSNEGLDTKARYRLRLEKSKDKDKYILKVVDAFNFPVNFLTLEDIVVLSDSKPLKNFTFKEDADPKLESGRYILGLKLEPKQALVEWPAARQSLDPKGSLIFKLNDLDKIKHVIIKHGADVLLDVQNPTQADVSLPLFYFGVGTQKVTVVAEDGLGQRVFADDVDFSLKLQNDFSILSPLPNDTVHDQVGIVLALSGMNADTVAKVIYEVEGKALATASGLDYFHSLDLGALPVGDVHLKVRVQLADKELTHDVVLKKVASDTKFKITNPAMGVFAENDLPIAYQITAPEKVTDLSVWVNGNLYLNSQKSDKTSDVAITLPVSRWQNPVLYVVVQATTASGQKYSDWMQVNRGRSQLSLKFDLNSLGFLNVSQAAIVLDASVSNADSWQGKSKWATMTGLILHPDTQARLENLKPALYVSGSETPYYYGNCSDATALVKAGEYKKSILKQKLEDITPKGVSALAAGLKLAYSTKPERVFLFADSADSCDAHFLSTLKKLFKDSPKTMVSVFALGKVQDPDAKRLQDLAQQTGGHYFQPDDVTALTATWLKELSLNFQLTAADRVVDEAPLVDKSLELSPGDYTLKIPYGNDLKEIPVHLTNGAKTTLIISGKNDGDTHVIGIDQSESKLQ